MTFYEAALRVLEAEGRPLHFSAITEKSIQQQLLSHVGKTPEQTMLSRLAAMARRTRDRKVIVTAKDTFALVDWQLPEDLEALAQTGVPEPNPEEDLPPLRPAERHPDPRNDNVRGAGRVERDKDRDRPRRRQEEEEGGRRRRRFPPIPEVAFEILSEAGGGLRADQLANTARERGLAGDELGTEQILMALLEDNQRRIDAGRRPQFQLQKDSGQIVLERASAPSDVPPHEMQAAFAEALNIPMEGGRPLLPRPAPPIAGAEEAGAEGTAGNHAAKLAVKDARKSVARALRRRLSELDTGTFEKSVVKMLHGVGFRELKVAKRSKEGPLLTARKREGSVELRYAVRMLKGSPAIDRRMVQDLRRDLGHYSAQVGLLLSAGEVRGDARTEAQASGSLVMLWCGDALGDKLIEAKAGVSAVQVELYELDDRFFENARIDAEEAARRREERHREKEQREAEAPPPREERAEEDAEAPGEERFEDHAVPSAAGGLAPPQAMEDQEGAEGDEGDEGDEDEGPDAAPPAPGGPEGAPGQPGQGERKRRRRRRRGRRGRGARPEGAPGQPGQPGQQAQGQGQGQPGGQPGGQAAPPPVQSVEGGHAVADFAPRPGPAPEPAAPPPPPPAPSDGEPGQG